MRASVVFVAAAVTIVTTLLGGWYVVTAARYMAHRARQAFTVPDEHDLWPGGADEPLDEALLRRECERGYSELAAFLAHPSQQGPDT